MFQRRLATGQRTTDDDGTDDDGRRTTHDDGTDDDGTDDDDDGTFFENISKSFFNNVPIYSQIHRFRIRYSKYQFVVQNTPKMPNRIRHKPEFLYFSKI